MKLLITLLTVFASASVFAAESTDAAAFAYSAAFAITIAAVGGAFAQGKAAATALEGIARNPEASGKITTTMIIAAALIEGVALFGVVVGFLGANQ